MRAYSIQSSFLAGVLDPRASGRVDTDTYAAGLLTGTNVIVHHLGGVVRRPGLKFRLQLPNVLTFLTPSSATAANGGTAANGYDQSTATNVTTTTNIGTSNPYVVVRYDMGSAVSVSHADILDLVATGSSSDEFRIQYSSNDSDWTDYGDPLPMVDTVARSYRRSSLTSGAFAPVSARYWRIAKVGGTDMSTNTVAVAEFNLWADSGTVSEVRLFSFELTTETRYLVALTDRSATIFQDGVLLTNGTAPMPYVSADIDEVDAVVGADSLFIVHEDYPPRYIVDEFTGEDLQTGEVVFDTVPMYDYADSSSPTPTSEIQVITFDANWAQGDTFQLELDGARTGLISYAGDSGAVDQATTANNIARAVQKLYTVPGFTGVTCARTDTREYTVTFADASAKTYEGLMTATIGSTVSTSAISPTVTQSQAGVPRTEPVWSSTRGYPRTVTFYEGRFFFGGTRSRLQSLFGSAVNDPLAFELLEQLDADPIFVTLNGQQLNAINALFSGRNFQMFTSGGEFRYIQDRGAAITPSDAPSAQTDNGAKKIRPVGIDGTTVYVQRLGKSIRDFKYNYEVDAYDSLGLSSLAPHLINNVVDLAAWRGSSTDEINLVFAVNTDGTVAVLNLRFEVDVRAWTNWTTNGSFKAVETTVEEVYFAVLRNINGTDVLFLEQTDDDMYVDAGVNVVGGVADNAVHLTGETCRVRLNPQHLVLADQTGGTVTPAEAEYAASNIQVGLGFNPTVTPMPLNTNTAQGPDFMRKRRIAKIRAKVNSTLGLLVNGRQLPDRYFDIDDFDDSDPTPYSGNHDLEESTNWDEQEDKTITFTQVDPLPMNILSIVVDMETT